PHSDNRARASSGDSRHERRWSRCMGLLSGDQSMEIKANSSQVEWPGQPHYSTSRFLIFNHRQSDAPLSGHFLIDIANSSTHFTAMYANPLLRHHLAKQGKRRGLDDVHSYDLADQARVAVENNDMVRPGPSRELLGPCFFVFQSGFAQTFNQDLDLP